MCEGVTCIRLTSHNIMPGYLCVATQPVQEEGGDGGEHRMAELVWPTFQVKQFTFYARCTRASGPFDICVLHLRCVRMRVQRGDCVCVCECFPLCVCLYGQTRHVIGSHI